MSNDRVAIIGAGPAGIRAAQTLLAHGVKACLIDEGLRGGGQIYRRQPENFQRPAKALYGFESGKAVALHQTLDALTTQIDYRPQTLVWNVEGNQLDTLHNGTVATLDFTRLIVATGATDRILPVPGWTMPGVYSLGAAQIALKYQGCAIGERVVFCGSGPLLYLVAYQYAKAGANVLAVLDSAPFSAQCKALPALLGQPATLAKGLYYRGWLSAHGIPVHQGAHLTRINGDKRVDGIHWQRDGQSGHLACDAVAFAHALRSETQLADLLGCEFGWSPLNRTWLPIRDDCGRSSVPDVYLAGDGAGIMGADAAEMAGELAALGLLQDSGVTVDAVRISDLQTALQRIERFRHGLETAFPFPEDWAANVADDTLVCRCEEVSAGDIRTTVQDGHWEINRVKAMCRVGMGRCQGRMCGLAAAEIIARESGRPVEQVGRLRGQAPIKPLPFGLGMLPVDKQSAETQP
ncbi:MULTISPECIES: NAD(P)/FAD-dependent oxidoreductase [Pseudomonas]|uniref:Pyridine nucleotide-disulfide oxidoreductase protein n=2 Tax=Pseudomonas syringae group TaxID=136849 RepID=A0A3M4P0J8_PSEVI|nr:MULTISPECIES: FAD/NAD(P)-binding oxidoreductase [Pseudomonas]KTB73101.1 (2Fe-2S)-binding protein [Pseudomonas sp. ICMP 3272]KTC54656.1 FAD/NAD(P)-binding oxidoreductase [Pseudomonas syringae ICMP 19498]RMO96574.1 Pyridine nucleotide-disulfide oxidoreductase protein [Pseudomonas syringae pv. persicae]RMQ09093.1 Pyridine nucleotide-disulfide oxidoreductase protein [Pseudomonas viridiflava]RMQ71791.1 Pyridine nucleotide-disulfide oxidoreductase protein [Pseudomonas viridiflava]